MKIRKLESADWEAVSDIYVEGIATRNATFETEVPSWESWDGAHISDCRFVAEIDGAVRGWAALTPVSDRCVYGGVAEVSVYVAASSLRLHERAGFRLVGVREKLGKLDGRWRDVLLLERRSERAGVD